MSLVLRGGTTEHPRISASAVGLMLAVVLAQRHQRCQSAAGALSWCMSDYEWMECGQKELGGVGGLVGMPPQGQGGAGMHIQASIPRHGLILNHVTSLALCLQADTASRDPKNP